MATKVDELGKELVADASGAIVLGNDQFPKVNFGSGLAAEDESDWLVLGIKVGEKEGSGLVKVKVEILAIVFPIDFIR